MLGKFDEEVFTCKLTAIGHHALRHTGADVLVEDVVRRADSEGICDKKTQESPAMRHIRHALEVGVRAQQAGRLEPAVGARTGKR